jgi:hypothetical protein
VNAPQGQTVKVETEVKVKDLPEFRAELDKEKARVTELEGRLKTETEARTKAETEKQAAIAAKAGYDEKERLAKVAAVKAKFGDSIPDEVVNDLPSDKLDHLASDKVPAPKKAEPVPEKKEEAQSKAPPNGASPPPKKKKKEPWFNRDGLAYHVEETKANHEKHKAENDAKDLCKVHEKEIAKNIRAASKEGRGIPTRGAFDDEDEK